MTKVGAGKARVVLDGILPFDGFDAVHDDLHARALVVEADERACLVTLEVTSLRPDHVARLRTTAAEAAGCAEEAVWVCVTHTFSAPHVRTPEHLAPEERPRNERLADAYVSAVREAASRAAGTAVEATLSWGSASADVNVNRDVETPGGWWLGANPEGFSDHDVRVLVARRASDDSPLAVAFSCDVQSSVLDRSRTPDGRRLVSGDLAGVATARIERELPGCVALFVVGCAGDQAPTEQAVTQEVMSSGEVVRHDAHEAGFDMAERLGARLAQAAIGALPQAVPFACGHVCATSHPLTCPGQQRADFATLAPHRTYEYLPAEPVTTTVSVLELGELVLVGVEPELPSVLGSRIRREVASVGQGPADILTMVNGGAKYLPDFGAYDKITYEAMNSGFARGSDEILARDVLASVAAVRKGRHA